MFRGNQLFHSAGQKSKLWGKIGTNTGRVCGTPAGRMAALKDREGICYKHGG